VLPPRSAGRAGEGNNGLTLELAGLIVLAIFGIAFYIAVRVWVQRARDEDER
jgi:hypothetical protein